MDIENQEVFYCEDDGANRVFCEICDKLCRERYYKNPLKSGTHTNNFHKRQCLKDFKIILFSKCALALWDMW